ncbi:hypothetical protein A1O3_03641 [Capronia epimyces CBS 606.96]|uniref:Enoyl reductase (ER) domain-containing protein n=1 Tax=Capronia epimyces CBS 606.96 TaxID=1182542 RepID=W9Y2F6_9EURO|nr:uncharacterized protein A1O3_03641 [Capronia epimyces CBS 606.96]EXJ86688.1 hypothetical protein A1O3_03641 [Capronia epimyces CBS 606.96]
MARPKQKLTYLAGAPDGTIHQKSAEREIRAVEVVIRVTHSGLCGTDVHDRTAGCGLGHEGVGIVDKVGSEVTAVAVGQRVGWGIQHASCGRCRECLTGYRQCCPESRGQKYGEREQGAFGDYVVKHQDFVFPIPDAIESKHAGPLNCAGITVYEALRVADTQPSDRVGVVGLGGLGHLAVMYARAMGCDVVVFSGTEAKRPDAMALGATEFCLLPPADKGAGAGAARDLPGGVNVNVNVMLLCGGTLPDFDIIMPLLARRATIVPLVIQTKPLVIPYMLLLLGGHRIIGSTEATRENHVQALRFAARHSIKPWIVEFPMNVEGLTTALAALESGKVRYRAVLSRET